MSLRVVFLATLVLASMTARDATAQPGPWFTSSVFACREATGARGNVPKFARQGVAIVDRFTTGDLARPIDVVKPTLVCESGGAEWHLESYTTAPSRPRRTAPRFEARTEQVTHLTGDGKTLNLRLVDAGTLLVGSADAATDTLPSPQVGLRCYDVRLAESTAPAPKATPRPGTISYRGTTLAFEALKPVRLCVQASVDVPALRPLGRHALLCSRARLRRGTPSNALPKLFMNSYNRFGHEVLRLRRLHEICEPVELRPAAPPSCEAPTPTVSPTPTVAPTAARNTLESLSVAPNKIARLPGESKHFVVTGHFPGGITQDLTAGMHFASSDPTVAVAPNDPADPSRIDLLAQGTTTISATDPVTGISSTASGGDATLIATSPLRSITVSPDDVRRSPCQTNQYTAIGHYDDGVTRNITQDVVWSTTNPNVGIAPNPPGDRSRIQAIASGITGVIATDPTSGIASAECCGDYSCCAVLRVTGGLIAIYLEVTPRYSDFTPARAPATRRLAAYGYYSDGSTRTDLTESLLFTSDNPGAVETPNEPGDRGKLLVVGNGLAAIRARDPISGINSPPIYLQGLDGLRELYVPSYAPNPSNGTFVYDVGESIFFHVYGVFADNVNALLTSGVTLVSHDLTIAAPDMDGRLVALKGGVVTISAVDTATGISTADSGHDVTVNVRGPLQRLSIEPSLVKRLVGQDEQFLVLAHYEGGYQQPLSTRAELTASDPTVADVSMQFPLNRVIAAGRGTTTIAARDPATGITSTASGDDATFTVLGPLASIKVKPTFTVRAPGRSYFYTAIGTDTFGDTLNLTRWVNWTSTNTTVARMAFDWREKSRADTIATGTTFISVTEPLSGVTSTASAGDAQLDVIGTLTRLVLTSELVTLQVGSDWQLTANGFDALNRGTNLTQEVTYASSDPTVVAVTNETDHRSRIVAVAPGTATLSATDPISGIGSHTTGGDILITVTP